MQFKSNLVSTNLHQSTAAVSVFLPKWNQHLAAILMHFNFETAHAPPCAFMSRFGIGGGYLKDLYTTYVAYHPSKVADGLVLSPPALTFLHPGRPGLDIWKTYWIFSGRFYRLSSHKKKLRHRKPTYVNFFGLDKVTGVAFNERRF